MRAIKFIFTFLLLSSCSLLQEPREVDWVMEHQKHVSMFEGQEVYYVLSKGEILPFGPEKPKTFYVEGWIRQGKFSPKSKVLGIGNLGDQGRYGWLELNSNQFYAMESGKNATTPFIKGYKNSEGFFTPSEREVYTLP